MAPYRCEPEKLADRIIRRAEISKMARDLQDRLALASLKTKHGVEGAPFTTAVEKLLELESHTHPVHHPEEQISPMPEELNCRGGRVYWQSSPPPFMDENSYTVNHPVQHKPAKHRARASNTKKQTAMPSKKRPISVATRTPPSKRFRSWKPSYDLPQSSPTYRQHYQDVRLNDIQSQLSPLPRVVAAFQVPFSSPRLPSIASDDEDNDPPEFSFQATSSVFDSSPPRTPTPSQRTLPRSSISGFGSFHSDFEGPPTVKPKVQAPSTPPSQCLELPSSVMTTPGGAAIFSTPNIFSTPRQDWEFSDIFVTTPSPAPALLKNRTPARTPGTSKKTPRVLRETRRALNFDALAPPTTESPRCHDRDENPNNSENAKAVSALQLGHEFGVYSRV